MQAAAVPSSIHSPQAWPAAVASTPLGGLRFASPCKCPHPRLGARSFLPAAAGLGLAQSAARWAPPGIPARRRGRHV